MEYTWKAHQHTARVVKNTSTMFCHQKYSANHQLMVTWWFGLVVWILGIPLWKGLLLMGTPKHTQTSNSPLKAEDHPNNIQEYFKKNIKIPKLFISKNLSSPSFSPDFFPSPPNAWDAPSAAAAAPPVAAPPEAPRAAAGPAAPAVGSALRRGDGPARVPWPLRRYERLLELEATSGPGFRKKTRVVGIEVYIYRDFWWVFF